ncbi:MAG TPA: thioredoxin-disulfide reductase [Stellaceae bacterium]
MSQSQIHRTRHLILGSGPAGYTAAIYAARAAMSPLLVSGLTQGGQLTITTEVENYPGFGKGIMGPELMDAMRDQALHVGARLINDTIVAVDLKRRPFVARGDSGDFYEGETIAICTGAEARWLNVPGEAVYRGYGVSACATCDGFFFRGKEVVVVGGGNTAAEEALYLTHHASRVTLIHRRHELRADKTMQARLFANPKIRTVWNSVVEEILGEPTPPRVTGVRIRNVLTDEVGEIACDGFFIAIGHDPSTSLFRGQLELDRDGYLITAPDSTATEIPGVFAAGDVKDKVFRQAVTAAGMGCMAALEAERFLAEEDSHATLRAAE